MKPLLLVALLGCLASVFAAPADMRVKWCVISDAELRKCSDLASRFQVFSCVKRESTSQCITAISAGEADAVTLRGADIHAAGKKPYELDPIIAEDNNPTSDTCYYAVAVVKKSSTFQINDLRGKNTCHTGLGDPEGWNIPIGTLLSMGILPWTGIESRPLEAVVADFFQSSCVPGAGASLNQLCKGDHSKSDNEPYYGNAGAFRCLAEDAGEVAFVRHDAVPDSEKADYELLCKGNTRAPLENFKTCNLGRVPTHAVVSRKDPELAEFIWTNLNAVQGFNLFSSANYAPSKNLMFTDSTTGLIRVPPGTDSFLYLGPEYMKIISALEREQSPTPALTNSIKWCAVGHAETTKCDSWSGSTMENDQAAIECPSGSTVEECLQKIMKGEADAMAVDGGQVYTAGKCGLVPVMAEQYDEAKCSTGDAASSYYAVAVVKKDSGVTWANLQGKRSCHTGMGRTAGWNIPMGQIHKRTGDCDFTKFFSSGCAPGANISSPFCTQCVGSGATVGEKFKCKASAEEKYYGYAGAFRCLVEGAGDVAFIKHTIVPENSDGNGPDWAKPLRSGDYELICPGKGPVAVTEYESCNLARVPAHAVVSRPESRSTVVRILQEQQVKFGLDGSDDIFRMFQSDSGKNLLFKDSTKCLQEVQVDNYASFLGDPYMTAMSSLRECSGSTPDLEKSCTLHTCP